MSREKPTWIELTNGYSAAVGVLRRGRRGFFVLSRRSAVVILGDDDDSDREWNVPRFIVASGHYADGRVTIVQGVLSSDCVDELEVRLRTETARHE